MKNVMGMTTKTEWKKLVKKYKITDTNIKKFALKLYYSRFISLAACERIYFLMETDITTEETRKLLIDIIKQRKNHGFSEIPVIFYTNDKDAVRHMKELSAGVNEQLFLDMVNQKNTVKTRVKTPVKTPVKTRVKTPVKTSEPTLTDLKDMAKNKNIKGRSKMSKDELMKALGIKDSKKKCSDITLKELKKIASHEKIPGRSKMDRNQLCKALKIKV